MASGPQTPVPDKPPHWSGRHSSSQSPDSVSLLGLALVTRHLQTVRVGTRRDVCFLKGQRAVTQRVSPGEGVLLSAAKPMGSPAPGTAQARGPCAPSRGAGLQLTTALRLPPWWDGAAAPRARAAVQGPGVQTQHRGLRARASSGGERWHRKRGREAVCRGSGRHGARREAAGASGVACHGAAPAPTGGLGGCCATARRSQTRGTQGRGPTQARGQPASVTGGAGATVHADPSPPHHVGPARGTRLPGKPPAVDSVLAPAMERAVPAGVEPVQADRAGGPRRRLGACAPSSAPGRLSRTRPHPTHASARDVAGKADADSTWVKLKNRYSVQVSGKLFDVKF